MVGGCSARLSHGYPDSSLARALYFITGQDDSSLTRHLTNPSAEFTIETNAPPLGGYITSDSSTLTAGKDRTTLHSKGWTDDYDDLPIMHSFGYVYGYRELISVAR